MKVTFLPSLILSTNLIVAANQNNNNNNNNTFIPSPPTIILPPGCTCQKSNVLLSQCTAFNCDCNCDVTPDMCDYNCCCDEDCTNSDKECLYDDSKKNVVRMCYDSSVALENINAKFPMKVEESIEVSTLCSYMNIIFFVVLHPLYIFFSTNTVSIKLLECIEWFVMCSNYQQCLQRSFFSACGLSATIPCFCTIQWNGVQTFSIWSQYNSYYCGGK